MLELILCVWELFHFTSFKKMELWLSVLNLSISGFAYLPPYTLKCVEISHFCKFSKSYFFISYNFLLFTDTGERCGIMERSVIKWVFPSIFSDSHLSKRWPSLDLIDNTKEWYFGNFYQWPVMKSYLFTLMERPPRAILFWISYELFNV